MKNADRLRKMTDEELACFLARIDAALYRDDLDIVAYRADQVADALEWLKRQVYYHLVEKRKEKYNGLGTYDEKYQNSTTSVGEIVEYLKEIQKKGEVKNQW